MTPDATSDRPAVRVLRVITRLNIGGPSIQAIELSARLPARGFTTRLAFGRLGEGEGDMRYLLPAGAATLPIDTLQRAIDPVSDAKTLTRLLALMREFQPHILHTHMAKAGSIGRLAAVIYNRTAGQGARVRVVHTYHGHVLEGYFSPVKTRVFLGIERMMARYTDRLVAISPGIRTELLEEQRIGRADQYRVIPLGFDLEPFAAIDDKTRETARRQLDIPAGARVVSTVGRLTAIKDHGTFLDAARIVARDPAAVFLIVGDGELRTGLEASISQSELSGRTRFLGWRRDLTTIYGATDVFLLTSRNEGTPVAIIEALASGVPAVSTDVGGVRDVIEEGVSGLLAPAGDVSTLAAHVTTLLQSAPRRREMGNHGRITVVGRFHIDRLVSDVEALYRELRA
jgi:glycosyltransferase involved in cell wall biosynthesis